VSLILWKVSLEGVVFFRYSVNLFFKLEGGNEGGREGGRERERETETDRQRYEMTWHLARQNEDGCKFLTLAVTPD